MSHQYQAIAWNRQKRVYAIVLVAGVTLYLTLFKLHDARWRKIKIKLRTPKGLPPLSVYAKTGYYAPSL